MKPCLRHVSLGSLLFAALSFSAYSGLRELTAPCGAQTHRAAEARATLPAKGNRTGKANGGACPKTKPALLIVGFVLHAD